jgi:hypothetical protein
VAWVYTVHEQDENGPLETYSDDLWDQDLATKQELIEASMDVARLQLEDMAETIIRSPYIMPIPRLYCFYSCLFSFVAAFLVWIIFFFSAL